MDHGAHGDTACLNLYERVSCYAIDFYTIHRAGSSGQHVLKLPHPRSGGARQHSGFPSLSGISLNDFKSYLRTCTLVRRYSEFHKGASVFINSITINDNPLINFHKKSDTIYD